MESVEIILTAVISSLVCMGGWTALDEGGLLHFIQKPFIKHRERVESWQREEFAKIAEHKQYSIAKLKASWNTVKGGHTTREYQQDLRIIEDGTKNMYREIEISVNHQLFYQNIFKPLVLCSRCFASVWGTATFYALHGGINDSNLKYAIVNIFATAIINVLIGRYYD